MPTRIRLLAGMAALTTVIACASSTEPTAGRSGWRTTIDPGDTIGWLAIYQGDTISQCVWVIADKHYDVVPYQVKPWAPRCQPGPTPKQ